MVYLYSDFWGGLYFLGVFCLFLEWDINFRYILNIWFFDDKGIFFYSIGIWRIGDFLKVVIRCSDRLY